MTKAILAAAMFLPLIAMAQVTGLRPSQFTEETSPNQANFEFYSQKDDSTRRATFLNVQKNMAPQVEPLAIAYVPAASGNLSDLVRFVTTQGDSIYYIDGYGDAILLYNPADMDLDGFISGDTLYVNNLAYNLGPYRQEIDSAYLLNDTLYLSLSGDNVPAVSVDFTGFAPGLTAINTGPLLTYAADSLYLVSDTLPTDLVISTNLVGSGRFQLRPTGSAATLSIYSDASSVGMGSVVNTVAVNDTVISVTLSQSGSNTGEFKITDARTAKTGIEYAGDYTATMGTRSLVDAGYVAGVGKKDNVSAVTAAKVTAVVYNIRPVDVSGGAVTITPPASPTAGQWFAVAKACCGAGSNQITVEFTAVAQPYASTAADYVTGVNEMYARFTYVDATVGWIKSN